MDPERKAPYFTRGRIYASMGEEENAAGKDPRANFARAIEDFDRALERSPKFRDAWLHRGMIRGALGFSEDALGDFEKAGELTRGEDEHLKRMIEQERRLTELPRWARALLRAENLVRWADRAGARRLFEASFSEFEGKVDVKEMKMDGLVMFAYMHLARIYSLASAGKSGPGAKPEPLPEVEKEELRQKALLQIRKALEIGFNQFDFLRKDPQLAAVQGLPEFQSLLKEFEEKGK
jgi:tetratricopeptide (TPR) repeat protein